MSTIHLDNKQGTQTLERADHDLVQCVRCGIWRKARPTSTLCRDCRTVEVHTDRIQPAPIQGGTWTRRAGVWRWMPDPEPLSAEDRAWCEKAAEKGFWLRWEQLNRADENPLQPEAERRTRSLWTTGLHQNSDRMFDERTPTNEEGVA